MKHMKLDPKDPIVKQLADVMFVVDATSFEQHCLWREYHKTVTWDSDSSGLLVQLGSIDGRPVNLSLNWANLNGQKVMFVDSVSQLVDYQMVDDWLEANCAPRYDNGHRTARTNGMNFAHCLHAVADASGIALVHQPESVTAFDAEAERTKADAALDKELKSDPTLEDPRTGISARAAFHLGWLAGVRDRISLFRK